MLFIDLKAFLRHFALCFVSMTAFEMLRGTPEGAEPR